MGYKKKVAIIGAGPAGCMCAYFAQKYCDVTLFDLKNPLHTLLYTGGGRCNLAYEEYDFKELVKFYPRGEKFLYSIFSQFSTADTIEFFESIGVETYTQDDLRIFPKSNSAKDLRGKFLKSLKSCEIRKEKVFRIGVNRHAELDISSCSRACEAYKGGCRLRKSASNQLALTGKIPNQVRDDVKVGDGCIFFVKTDKNIYQFDKVVIAVGGHAGFELAKNLGHKIIEPKPALTGLITSEDFKSLQGISLKQVKAEIFCSNNDVIMNLVQHRISERPCDPDCRFDTLPCNPRSAQKQEELSSSGRRKVGIIKDDMIFTHEGISGPLAYKISSICAREDYDKKNPIKIKLDLIAATGKILNQVQDDVERETIWFQNLLNSNSQKDVKTLIAEFVPKSLAEYIVNQLHLPLKCHQVDGKTRDLILKQLKEFEITVISPAKEGEVVTSGGVCLDEINAKTMQSKLVEGLYFCGEVIDVDGFCGGFNLQNCWSTGFVAGSSI